jgi:hypothetical protein
LTIPADKITPMSIRHRNEQTGGIVKIIGVENVSPEQLKAELAATIVTNLRGGRDVTNEVVRSMVPPVAGVTRK